MLFQSLYAAFLTLPIFLQIPAVIMAWFIVGFFIAGIHVRCWGRPTKYMGDLSYNFFIMYIAICPALVIANIIGVVYYTFDAFCDWTSRLFADPPRKFMHELLIWASWGFQEPQPLPEEKVKELLAREKENLDNISSF